MQNAYSVNVDLERTSIRFNSIPTSLVTTGNNGVDLANLRTEVQDNHPATNPKDINYGAYVGNNYGGAAQIGASPNGAKYYVADSNFPKLAGHEAPHCFGVINGAHNNGPINNIEFTATDVATGNENTLPDGISIGNTSGIPGISLQVYSVSNAKNPGNPANGGDGNTVHQGEYFGDEYGISIPFTELAHPTGENTSYKIVDYHNSADPGAGHRFEAVPALDTPTVSISGDQITVANPANFDNLWVSNTTNPAFENTYRTNRKPQVYLYEKTNQGNNQFVWFGDLGETVDLSDEGLDPNIVYVLKVGTKRGNAVTSASADIDVAVDNPPIANCQDITVQLDASGNVILDPLSVNNSSTDDNGIVSYTVMPNTFNCSDVGTNTVTLTVTDTAGQTTDCTATVTVEDNIAPDLTTTNVAGFIDASGNYVANASDFVQTSNDACGIDSTTIDNANFSCTDLGVNTVQITLTDVNGNTTTESANLTLSDNINPTVIGQPATGNLNGTGTVTIPIASVDNGSFDNCTLSSLTLTPNTFTTTGTFTAVLEGTDTSSNSSSVNVTITIIDTVDTIDPVAICQNITVQLDSNGLITITGNDIDGGSTDNIAIATLIASPNSFDCTNIGANTVTLTVTDTAGNTDTCTATVTVEDDTAPINSTQTITLDLADGNPQTITWNDLDNGTTDNCTIASGSVSPNSFDTVGTFDVDFTTTDGEGNETTTVQSITVENTLSVADQEIAGFKMYPNPVKNSITIEIIGQLDTIKIYDIAGRIVKELNPQGVSKINVPLGYLSTGVYIINVYDKEGRQTQKRLVKE